MKRTETRLSLEDPAPRVPGQGVEELKQAFLDDKVMPWLVIISAMGAYVMVEWWRWWVEIPPSPWTFTIMGLAVMGYGTWRVLQTRDQFKNFNLGIKGERAVGAMLEDFRTMGYRILHDVPPLVDGGANIDHLLIGPAGLFVIETKMRRKPMRGQTRITYDGTTLKKNGVPMGNDPIIQVKAITSNLRKTLRDATGETKPIPIQPVVLFPGWYTTDPRSHGQSDDVWVLNHKLLKYRVEKIPNRLRKDQINRYTAAIERVIHSSASPAN